MLVRRTGRNTYHLLDPGGRTAIDMGQIKEFVLFDWLLDQISQK
jgi:hypothetical protein